MEEKKEIIKGFYKEKWFMWVSLVLFAPIGIFLLWKFSDIKRNTKIFITVVFSFVFLLVWGQINSSSSQRSEEIEREQLLADNKVIVEKFEDQVKVLADDDSITLDDEDDVNLVKSAYLELNNEQKGLIQYDSIKALVLAENTVETLKVQAAEEKAVEEKAAAEQAAAQKAAEEQAAAEKAAAVQQAAATQQSATEQQTTETISVTVYTTNTGSKYHLDGCSSLSKSKIPISLEDAKNSGLTACSKCHPPQ